MSIIIKSGNSTDLAAVKPASTSATNTDPALVVQISPNSPSQSVTGTVSVGNFPATQPVSAAALPLPTGAATSALQTQPGVDIGDVTVNNASGASAVNIQDGGNSITIDGSVSVTGSVAVTGPLTDTQLRASAVPVSASSLPLPTGAATAVKQPALGTAGSASADVITVQGIASMTALKVDGSAVTQPVSIAAPVAVTGPLTDAQLRATPVPISGSISATNPSVSTTGSAPPASATLSGGSVTTAAPAYTNGQMSALSLSTTGGLRVDGSGVTQPISGSVTIASGTTTVTQATGTNLHVVVDSAPTTAVTGPLTDTQIRATPVPVSGSVTATVSGSVTANAGTNLNTSALALDATLTGRTQKTQITDGTRDGTVKAASTAALATDTAFVVAISPNNTVPVSLASTTITGSVAVTGPLTDTQLRATAVPVSLTSTTVTGSVAVTGPLTDTQIRATPLPVSGTVTANAGTNLNTSALALDATLTGGTQKTLIVNGANTAAVKAASTAAAATDPALVVAISPNNTVPVSLTSTTITGSVAVTGPLTDTQLRATPVPVSGTVSTGGLTDTQLRATAVPVSLTSTTITGSVAVTGPLTDTQIRATPLPISGTVTANAGTNLNTSALALDATLTGRTQKTQITDGTRDGTVKAASTAALATDTALVVAISPNNTVPVSLTSTTITGSVAVTGPLTDTQLRATPVPVSGTVSTGGLTDTQIRATPLPVSGTVTANAGTNLNTSALALDTTVAKLTIAQGTALGSNTQAMVGGSVTTAAPTYTTGTIQPLSLDTTGALRIAGTISATNPSVSATGAAPPASATYSGGSVTTAAPTYTTGTIQPLSLDTTGALRITGSISASNPSVSTTGSAPPASATLSGGSVTTAAPAYTNGQMSGLSLTTAGALRVDASGTTQPVSLTSTTITGSVAVTGPLTDTQLRASAVPVSLTSTTITGTVTTTALTDTQLRATPVPVSGTVTANAGTNLNTSALALDATLTGGTARTKITDGSNNAAVKAASTAAVAADPAVVVAVSPNNTLQNNLAQVAGSTVSTAATGVQKVGIVGNAGAALDAAGQNAASPANSLLVAGQFNTTPSTIASGNMSPLQVDNAGNLKTTNPDTVIAATSLGALNAAVSLGMFGNDGIGMTITAISSPSGIVLTPQLSFDGGTSWSNSGFVDPITGNIFATLDNTRPKAFAAGQQYHILAGGGASNARVIATSWTSGSVTVSMRASDADPIFKFSRNSTGTTYSAAYVLAATTARSLSNAMASTTKQFATLFHASTAIKTIRVKRVEVQIVSNSVAGLINADLVTLTSATTPTTGNPAITPTALRIGSAAAEATCLALPTTAGTIGGYVTSANFNLGIIAGQTVQPPANAYVLFDDSLGSNIEPLIIPAGTTGGIAVILGANAATTTTAAIKIVFVEE